MDGVVCSGSVQVHAKVLLGIGGQSVVIYLSGMVMRAGNDGVTARVMEVEEGHGLRVLTAIYADGFSLLWGVVFGRVRG